ncbi:MAG: hypothetical protein CVU55_02585 [Deltaproteobacteria bacterium HGW-Deltaproteobacteria-13]|jgi:hypothetical protein|nr:MAG: hypothetical protein CVU55_02585 [Deltaproteobacteria bacterium HGW-Deltaproteobacteria-13]
MRSNKGQLVNQHLEKIDWSVFEKYQDFLKEYIKGQHGVYALYNKNNLYYVGLASNLRNRLKKHLSDRHAGRWDKFSVYLTVNDLHMHELESLILRIFSPEGNKQSGKFINSKNLIAELKKAFLEAKYKELIKLGIKTTKVVAKKKIKKAKEDSNAVLAHYAKNRFKIRFIYKGVMHTATVRKDGTINYKGKFYNSPSMAARAITERPTNGWTTWKYQNTSGDWVILDVLRRNR